MNTRLPHYCVVGGGFAGLTTAYFLTLAKTPGTYRLTVLESSPRFGGWIKSVKNPRTGAAYDIGPHSARVTSPASNVILRVALSLGLQNSFLWMCRDQEVARQYIYVKGQLFPVSPLGFRATEPFTRSPLGLIARRLVSRPPQSKSDLSVDEFLRTRLDDEFADYLGSAMMRGIFAGDSRELSARACLPLLTKGEARGPNMIIGTVRNALDRRKKTQNLPEVIDRRLPKIGDVLPSTAFAWSLSGGMQTLTDSVVDRMKSSNPLLSFYTDTEVTGVNRSGERFNVNWKLKGGPSKNDEFDAVFLCCPSFKTAELLRSRFSDALVTRLERKHIPWTDVAAVTVEVDKAFQPPFRGFGHLVPRIEDAHILGVIYDSVAFPQLDSPQGNLRYTVMMKPYANWLSADFASIKTEVEQIATEALIKQLKLPNLQIIDRDVNILRDCIPQYPLGHLENISAVRKEISSSLKQSSGGLHLVGFSYDGVGLGDVVRSSLKAVCEEFNLPM